MLAACQIANLGQMLRPCRITAIKDNQTKISITASLTGTADALGFDSARTIAQSSRIHKGHRHTAQIHFDRDDITGGACLSRGDDRITTRNRIQGG